MSIVNRFIQTILRFSSLIVVFTVVLTGFMGFQAVKISVDTNVNALMPETNQRIQRIKKNLGVSSEISNLFFLSISGENLYSVEVLQEFEKTINRLLSLPEYQSALTPFNFIHFDSKGKRIIPEKMAPRGIAPRNNQERDIFQKRVFDNNLARNYVVGEKGYILNAIFQIKPISDIPQFMENNRLAIEPLKKIIKVYTGGEVPFQSRVAYYLAKDFPVLLTFALAVMLILLWLSFRSFRSVFLPIIVVLMGAIWSLGFMSMAGYPITVVTVIIPSLILTIGSSYTIHVINGYYRSAAAVEGRHSIKQIANAVEHVFRTVVVASLTTMICFLSLLTTSLKPLKEFGLSISLGIFFCAILALFFLPSAIYLIGPPKQKHHDRVKSGKLTKIVALSGHWATRNKFPVLMFFAILFIAFLFSYPAIPHQSDYFSYFPSNDKIIQDARIINKNSGGSQSFNITISSPEGKKGYFLNRDVLARVEKFEKILDTNPYVTGKTSFNTILKSMNKASSGQYILPESRGLILLLYRIFNLIPSDLYSIKQDIPIISADADKITIYLRMAEMKTFNVINEDGVRLFKNFVQEELNTAFGTSVDTYLWGNTILLLESSSTIKKDQMYSTVLSILLGILITWILFRSFVYSLITLIPLLSGIFFYFVILYLTKIPLDLTTILVTNVTVGVGLDDAVHFLLHYRNQRQVQSYKLALSSSIRTAGRPIVLTTVSLVFGLIVLTFSNFKPIIYFGFLIASTLFSTMAGTIIFIPAVITMYESWLERRKKKSAMRQASKKS